MPRKRRHIKPMCPLLRAVSGGSFRFNPNVATVQYQACLYKPLLKGGSKTELPHKAHLKEKIHERESKHKRIDDVEDSP